MLIVSHWFPWLDLTNPNKPAERPSRSKWEVKIRASARPTSLRGKT